MSQEALFDTSALIALFRRERGWQTLKVLADTGNCATSAIAFVEMLRAFRNPRINRPLTAIDAKHFLQAQQISILDFPQESAMATEVVLNAIRERNQLATEKINLSLGDVSLIALGITTSRAIVFSDRAWESLDIPGVKMLAFR